MKAWVVLDKECDEGYQEYVFADTRGEAILKSEAFGDSGVFINMRARRLKCLDNKEHLPENEKKRILIREESWWWNIGNDTITEDNLDEFIEKGLI